MNREGFLGMPPDWSKLWQGMPTFNQRDLDPYQQITISLRSPEDRELLAKLLGRSLTNRTKSVWYPKEVIESEVDKLFEADPVMNPRYPVYVISKGRWESRLTVKALERMKVPHRVVIEPQEYDEYASVMDEKKLLVLPFSDLGQGSIPARNWVWQHSMDEGYEKHWILDDNIRRFLRLWNNIKTPVGCGNIFRAAEDFVDRFENVGQAGFQYYMFIPRKSMIVPYTLNTRIYSCILIRNDIYPEGSRWRGRYNEDTDLSLRILKDGWCTILFNAFMCHKTPTMTMSGGNTDELYKGDGRLKMAESLREQHPDVVEITEKWGRWQHEVDYSRFKRNRLKMKGTKLPREGQNEYGMYLRVFKDGDDSCKEPLLMIGQAPGQNGISSDVLGGRTARRLSKLAGVSVEHYMETTERMNMFDEWPGKNGKGDDWDCSAAKERAEELKPVLEGRRVLFVGRNVAKAFGYMKLPFLEWSSDDELQAEVACIPHPSGIVTWWNESDNRMAAADFLADALGEE